MGRFFLCGTRTVIKRGPNDWRVVCATCGDSLRQAEKDFLQIIHGVPLKYIAEYLKRVRTAIAKAEGRES